MITQEELKELVHYDPETGVFTHATTKNGAVEIGQVAGCKHTDISGKRYMYITLKRKKYRAHRMVWLYIYGELPPRFIDHINGDGTDNRLINLRLVDDVQNARNQRRQKNNTTGVSGVTWHKQCRKWCVRINNGTERLYLGLFDTLLDAAVVRITAQRNLGYHPNHGEARPL